MGPSTNPKATDSRNISSTLRGKNMNKQAKLFTSLLDLLVYRKPPDITMASVRALLRLPPLIPRHRNLRIHWDRKYVTLGMSYVLFTDETRTYLTVSQMVTSISEISVTNIFNVKNELYCGLVWLRTNLLALSGCQNGLK